MQRAIADELKLPLRGREDLVDAEILRDHLRVDHLLDLDLERGVSTRRREVKWRRKRRSDGEKIASVVFIGELLALEDLKDQFFLNGSNPDGQLRLFGITERRGKRIRRPAKSEWKRRSDWSNNPPRRPSEPSPRPKHRYLWAESTRNRQKEKEKPC